MDHLLVSDNRRRDKPHCLKGFLFAIKLGVYGWEAGPSDTASHTQRPYPHYKHKHTSHTHAHTHTHIGVSWGMSISADLKPGRFSILTACGWYSDAYHPEGENERGREGTWTFVAKALHSNRDLGLHRIWHRKTCCAPVLKLEEKIYPVLLLSTCQTATNTSKSLSFFLSGVIGRLNKYKVLRMQMTEREREREREIDIWGWLRGVTFTSCTSCLMSWLCESCSRSTIHWCLRTCGAVSRWWGSTCSILDTMSW